MQDALIKYDQASKIKRGAPYPKEKIKQCETALSHEKVRKELFEKFNTRKGDELSGIITEFKRYTDKAKDDTEINNMLYCLLAEQNLNDAKTHLRESGI
jgi:hypothetical protein